MARRGAERARRSPFGLSRRERAARLWAPWRGAYLRIAGKPGHECIFCFGTLGARERRRRLVLYAGPLALVMLNRYPYNNGHLMIAPRRHRRLARTADARRARRDCRAAGAAVERLREALRPRDGFNLGANLGRSAGRGIRRSHALARGAALERRQQFHAGTCGDPRALATSGRRFDAARPLFKTLGAALS